MAAGQLCPTPAIEALAGFQGVGAGPRRWTRSRRGASGAFAQGTSTAFARQRLSEIRTLPRFTSARSSRHAKVGIVSPRTVHPSPTHIEVKP